VLKPDRPRRLAYTWNACPADARRKRTSHVTFELKPRGNVVKLTVTHDNLEQAARPCATFPLAGRW